MLLARISVTGLLLVLPVAVAWSAAEAVDLPPGVKAVWDGAAAYREATPTRERICINGLWRWQPADVGATAVPATHWGFLKVPACWPGITDYMQYDAQTLYPHPAWEDVRLARLRAAWYEREITLPEAWNGRRIALDADLVNSFMSVFVDGRPAGEIRFPGGELDLTPLRLEPGRHRLSALVVALPLKAVMQSYSDSAAAREVEGSVARRGLCGDVTLLALPEAERIGDVQVMTSVRQGRIELDTALERLDPAARYSLEAVITRDGQQLARFESPSFTAADLNDGRLNFGADWKPDRLWDLHTPENVQSVSLSLIKAEKAVDTFWDQRFGFREFEIQGRDFLLNGTRIQLSAVPLDNAQVSAALATYEAARESLERLQSFGINFVYTHNYGCEPGTHLAFQEILRAADDAGVLVALSQPHFSQYEWSEPTADQDNGYRRHAAYYTRVAGNHPSVVFYSMSHNATGYAEDMNPDLFGTADEAPRDTWALRNVERARRAQAIVESLDPSRIVYHHASGNLGVMHDSNFYPNFVPLQELSDWFETWSTEGVKPAFLCEYGAPFTWDWTMYRGWYKGERSFGSAQVPWEFCQAEWSAQFLGDRAYRITEAEKENLRWEARQLREGRLWYRWDYPHEVSSEVFDDRHEVIGRYLSDNFRSFRTWGVSGISPWEHNHFWRLKPDVDRGPRPLAVDWDRLQRPGYSPDFIGPTYERMDLAFNRDDWEPTADAQALLRNNRPLLGYIAGKPAHFTSKDHNFRPGESVSKQLIVLNNARQDVTCEVAWSVNLPGMPVQGASRVELATGQQRRIPLEIPLPSGLAAGRYTIEARFAFHTGETQQDTFPIDVLPRAEAVPVGPVRLALYDPKGETAALLESLGISAERVEPGSDLAGVDVLCIGKEALTLAGPAPRLDRVREGLQVIVFEQTAAVLERRLGFRVQEYGLRQVFPRVADHPLLAGLREDHLHDWRGEATVLPARLAYELSPTLGPTVRWCDIPVSRVWRCGNRGNVASVLIEKPARGDFLPIVDGGHALQYSPLIEYREGQGRIVFCQLDVTNRTEGDPAAELIVRNLLARVSDASADPPTRAVVYAGEPAGLDHLRAAGFDVSRYDGGDLGPGTILVAGPGGAALLAGARPDLTRWLAADGRLIAVGLDSSALGAFLPDPPQTRPAEHIAAWFDQPGHASRLAGVSPADVHNRDPRVIPRITGGAEITGDGVLATASGDRVVFCQLVPWQFDPEAGLNQKRTYRRVSFVLSRLLANLGAGGGTPILERIATPVAATETQPRFQTGLYLDQPEEWDDPYRFFRW